MSMANETETIVFCKQCWPVSRRLYVKKEQKKLCVSDEKSDVLKNSRTKQLC